VFDFETTADIPDGPFVVGQERAEEAFRFGVGMTQAGYNVYVVGDAGMGRRALVKRFLEEEAAARPVPDDWCYVNNFEDETRPLALRLPPGRGVTLRDGMARLIDDLGAALHAAFESEEYQLRRQVVQEAAREQEEEALQSLQARAREQDIAVLRTPTGFAFAPLHDGEVISSKDLQGLPEEQQKKMQEAVTQFQEELQHILRQLPRRMRQLREELRKLNREVAEYAASELVAQIKDAFEDQPQVTDFIDRAVGEMMKSIETAFLEPSDEDGGTARMAEVLDERTYGVNVLVDHTDASGAPIVHEDNPHYQGLVGEVEQIAQMGTLTTDFNLIKPGALHRANGGYLVVDARKLLMQSFAWEGLKRSLYAKEVRIESAGKALGLMSTVSLEPEPIPLDVKVIVIGEPMLYYLLQAHDPDFAELFKVLADFDDQAVRGGENDRLYAGLLAALGQRDGLLPLDRPAVGLVIEHSSRIAGDAERLSTNLQQVNDLLREADYWAREEGRSVVGAGDVRRALDAREHRQDRLRDRIHEQILRETIHIETSGAVVGQINGLAVLEVGGFAFGKPSRITARVRMGMGEVVDIEREVALGGPLHSKGMLILSGYVGARYAPNQPLSLSASIVFEQSYGGVDGDSASSTELYALLSAIAGVPLRQSIAVTGSVDQRGRVQPIGGVNEKIEGFFRICSERGLTGDQGVIIPSTNVPHLMLREDVIEAVGKGLFHVYPVDHIDRGLEILTGIEAGEADADGSFPEGTLNRRIADRLAELTDHRIAFARRERGYDHG
jgi:lon-related putative ATP-dependent protease